MPASPDAQTKAYDQRSSGLQSLKFREIETVRKQMMIDARDTCHATRAAYVECATGRTFSVAWACRDVFREFNDCLKLQTTDVEFEKRLAAYRESDVETPIHMKGPLAPGGSNATPLTQAQIDALSRR
mmetsp:Transcript_6531/g.15310  ORF Transcript_6531/g.15310 Transcript_6531/m.15310 type:complete len:128 (-) Transcript_6531:174-557(-)